LLQLNACYANKRFIKRKQGSGVPIREGSSQRGYMHRQETPAYKSRAGLLAFSLPTSRLTLKYFFVQLNHYITVIKIKVAGNFFLTHINRIA
jgi:hypothetical protein